MKPCKLSPLLIAGMLVSLTITPKVIAANSNWQEKWESALAGAKKEGTLSLYGMMTQQGRNAISSKMQERFGIKFEFTTAMQGELIQKLTTERQAGMRTADAFQGSAAVYMNYLKPKGMLAKIEPLLILPEAKADKYWLNGKFPMFDKDGMVVAICSGYFSYILVNTSLVTQGEISGYRDVLNPKWKGKIVMLDPTTGPSPAETFVNYFIPRLLGREAGESWLKELVKQDVFYTRDSRQQVEWVARGKYPIGIAARDSIVGDFIQAGASITFVRPVEGGMLATAGTLLGILNNAPHPHAATVFLNWVLGDEGQGMFADAYNLPPRRLGAAFTASNQFAVVRPGDKIFDSDETFYIEGQQTAHWVKEIFGPVVGK